jgi:predicted peroxiredoxin
MADTRGGCRLTARFRVAVHQPRGGASSLDMRQCRLRWTGYYPCPDPIDKPAFAGHAQRLKERENHENRINFVPDRHRDLLQPAACALRRGPRTVCGVDDARRADTDKALVLTTEVFRQHKAIRILLCGPAGDLALREGEERIVQPINKSPQMLLRSLIERGVTVQICPLYLPNRGASADELIEGVTRAKPPLVAEQLLREGVRLFTF